MKTFLISTFYALIAFTAPTHPLIATVFCVILFDLILGVSAARKRGEKITSAGLRRTNSKFWIYSSTILLVYMVEKFLISEYLPLAKIVATGIGIVELQSVREKIQALIGVDIFKDLLRRLGSKNDTN